MHRNGVIIGMILGVLLVVVAGKVSYAPKSDREEMPAPIIVSEEPMGNGAGNVSEEKNVDVEKNNFLPPIDRAGERITKKPFSIRIDQKTSPVQPERFSGYHTGTDFEVFPEEENVEVSILSICSGEIVARRFVSGYGGVVVVRCEYEGDPITVLFGHLALSSVSKSAGERVEKGETLGRLGAAGSEETDGERKHLHLGVHRGTTIDFRGYVSNASELEPWIDLETLFR